MHALDETAFTATGRTLAFGLTELRHGQVDANQAADAEWSRANDGSGAKACGEVGPSRGSRYNF
jgi:hypothetical protein